MLFEVWNKISDIYSTIKEIIGSPALSNTWLAFQSLCLYIKLIYSKIFKKIPIINLVDLMSIIKKKRYVYNQKTLFSDVSLPNVIFLFDQHIMEELQANSKV